MHLFSRRFDNFSVSFFVVVLCLRVTYSYLSLCLSSIGFINFSTFDSGEADVEECSLVVVDVRTHVLSATLPLLVVFSNFTNIGDITNDVGVCLLAIIEVVLQNGNDNDLVAVDAMSPSFLLIFSTHDNNSTLKQSNEYVVRICLGILHSPYYGVGAVEMKAFQGLWSACSHLDFHTSHANY